MPISGPPPLTVVATLVNGSATAVFPSRPYPRVVITVDMVNSVVGGATIYRGNPSGAFTRIAGSPQGSNQQYTQPFKLPSGQQLFVVWASTPANLSGTRASITWLEVGK